MPKIALILGSKSDLEVLKDEIVVLDELKLDYSLDIISAHRHPEKLRTWCLGLAKKGVKVVVAGAGMAAALPGFVASYTDVPVIGVALKGGMMDGLDAVMSMVSVPKGLGVCCSGLGKSGFVNAVILALEILAAADKKYKTKLEILKAKYK
jgi:5-(carboxyamino)imidazole ribonucleotide mutase